MKTPKTEAAVLFTHPEAEALLVLINEAVKAKGLEVAANAVVLTQRIQRAFVPDDTAKNAEFPPRSLGVVQTEPA